MAGNWHTRPAIIDTHAHLELPHFSKDLSRVIGRARAVGVTTILSVGIDVGSCGRTLRIADAYSDIYAIIGMHPHRASGATPTTIDQVRSMASHRAVRALGEIGLDFYRSLSPEDVQRSCFRDQISLAKELQLPLVIHSRNATTQTLKILREEHAYAVGGVVHCFYEDATTARAYLDMGFYLSIPGIITFSLSAVLKDVVRMVPADRILLETDAPFLTPVPHRGSRNEPAYVIHTAQIVADIRGQDVEELATITSENARHVFRLPAGT
jgi:TatD DNase family protein